MKKINFELKFKLIRDHGSLRAASKALSIDYYRLSTIVNGWVEPNENELLAINGVNRKVKEMPSEKIR